MSYARILLVGEVILDTTIPVELPPRGARVVLRRSAPLVYGQVGESRSVIGGVFYLARFLKNFAQVTVVCPMPEEGIGADQLQVLLKARRRGSGGVPNIQVHPIPLGRDLYQATRFIEDERSGRGLMRIDSGASNPMLDDDVKAVSGRVQDLLRRGRSSRPDCIVLADYDLGLFTRSFINQLEMILEPLDGSVPLIIYAGRRWRKFCGLPNCYIVTERVEAVAEVVEAETIEDEYEVGADPSAWVAARYPELMGLVIVDGLRTEAVDWSVDESTQSVTGRRYVLETGLPTPNTPVGHRAIITGRLALATILGQTPDQWLVSAHELARHNVKVLKDEFYPDDAKSLLADRLSGFPTEFTLPAALVLRNRLIQDDLVLKLGERRTKIAGLYTFRSDLRRSVNDAVDRALSSTLPRSFLSPKHVVQKLLIVGPSRSGKTTIALELAGKWAELRAGASRPKPSEKLVKYIKCSDLAGGPDRIAEELRVELTAQGRAALVLDEVDKITKGAAVQRKFLSMLEDSDRDIPSEARVSLLVTIASFDPNLLNSLRGGPKNGLNLPDFYTRFPATIVTPSLSGRPMDAVYMFAARLLEGGVSRISLNGLVAVANVAFSELGKLNDAAKGIADAVEGPEAPERAFVTIGLACPAALRVTPDVLVLVAE